MFHVVLVEPEIPQNTGNIARTCAATGCVLHLVKPLGFDISENAVRRAGLDYWQYVDVRVHEDLEEAFEALRGMPFFFFTTKAETCYTDVRYPEECALFFGKETAGLDEELLVKNKKGCVRIPMTGERRSLNLSNCVAVAVYEAFRQNQFGELEKKGALHRLKW